MAVSPDDTNENRSIYRLRWIGYGLLVFALIDAIQILASIRTSDPTWGLQTVGQFVERVVVPLLGFALVFFGEFYDRKPFEKIVLWILSWLCLLLAFLFLVMVPSVGLQASTLSARTDLQVSQRVDQQLVQLQQLEDQLNRSTPQDIKKLADQLNTLGLSVDAKNPGALKTQIQSRIKTLRDQLQAQAQGAKASQSAGLIKNAVKWALGALVACALFVYLWISSNWAR
ncbi:MAG: hypothetical protein HC866_05815 [Leptolyngbyaceae cyanobacterium RU_5_1]|nr:hypothetical protein [Leptolyngbyaceae cyanobacterium RU_5_1]